MALYIGNGKKVSVKVIKDGIGNIEGTAIPIGETVERIYFNTHNTVEETNAILSQLTFVQTPLLPLPLYAVYASTTDGYTGSFIIITREEETGSYYISEVQNINTEAYWEIYYSASFNNQISNGWHHFIKPDTYNVVGNIVYIDSMNPRSSTPSLSEFMGIPVGAENEKIKSVLSVTPFFKRGGN